MGYQYSLNDSILMAQGENPTQCDRKGWYEAYLKSDWWQYRRKVALEDGHRECVKCKSHKRLRVHHLYYDRLWREEASDLQVMCEDCHNVEHGGSPRGQGKARSKIAAQTVDGMQYKIRPGGVALNQRIIERVKAGEAVALLRKGRVLGYLVSAKLWVEHTNH